MNKQKKLFAESSNGKSPNKTIDVREHAEKKKAKKAVQEKPASNMLEHPFFKDDICHRTVKAIDVQLIQMINYIFIGNYGTVCEKNIDLTMALVDSQIYAFDRSQLEEDVKVQFLQHRLAISQLSSKEILHY